MSKRKQANKKQYSGDGEYSDLQDNASMDSEDVTYSDVNKPRPAKSASSNPNNLKLVLKIGQVKNEAGLDHPMDPNIMNPPTYPATEPPGAKMTENPLKIKIRLSGGGRDAMTGAPLLPTHTGTPSKGKRTRPGEHMESDDMALEEEHVTPTQPRGRGRPSSRQKRKREEGIGTPQSPASSYQTGVEEDEDSDSDFENRSQSSSHLLDQSGLVGVEGMDTFNMPHGRGRGKKNDKKAGAVGTPATPQGAGPTGNAQSTKKKQQPKTRSSMRKKQKKKQPSSPTSGGQETYGSYESDPENLDAPHPYYCTPPNFWKNLEPYFQDLTQADIDALMPKNDGIDPDDVYFHLPALGTHYKDVWQEEDEKGIDSSYGRQSSRLTTSRGQFGDMTHDEGLDGFGDNNMLAQSKDHFAEEEPVRCENFTSRILSAMLEEHLTLPGSYGQSPLNKKAMDGRQGNPFNKSGTMPLNRSVSGYGADPFGGEFENGGYGAPNYPNNPLGLAIPLGIAPVEGYSYQSQLLLNEKIKQELMNLGLDLSEPEPPPSTNHCHSPHPRVRQSCPHSPPLPPWRSVKTTRLCKSSRSCNNSCANNSPSMLRATRDWLSSRCPRWTSRMRPRRRPKRSQRSSKCCSPRSPRDEVRRDRDARPTPPQQQRRVPRRRTPAHPRSPTTTPLRSSRGELGQANL